MSQIIVWTRRIGAVALVLSLIGCGQYGPLYLPESPTPTQAR